jgi:hypothetical protein
MYPCPVASLAWPSDGGLQEVLSTEYFSNFDCQSFDIATIDPMPSLF